MNIRTYVDWSYTTPTHFTKKIPLKFIKTFHFKFWFNLVDIWSRISGWYPIDVQVLELGTYCGYSALRMVGDNFSREKCFFWRNGMSFRCIYQQHIATCNKHWNLMKGWKKMNIWEIQWSIQYIHVWISCFSMFHCILLATRLRPCQRWWWRRLRSISSTWSYPDKVNTSGVEKAGTSKWKGERACSQKDSGRHCQCSVKSQLPCRN